MKSRTNSTGPKVLVIGKEPGVLQLLDRSLTEAGYLVLVALSGKSGVLACRQYAPSLVVLDAAITSIRETCRRLRSEPGTARVPLLVLWPRSHRNSDLDYGADAYISGLPRARELVARAAALLRRSGRERIKVPGLVIAEGRRTARVGGRPVGFTGTEFEFLRALTQAGGRVLSRQDLLRFASEDRSTSIARTVDVHISSIRRKLGRWKDLLETVRGAGYRFRQRG